MCQASLRCGVNQWLNTPTLEGAPTSSHLCSMSQGSIQGKVFSFPFGRVTMVSCPSLGDAGVLTVSVLRMKQSPQKSMNGLALLFHAPKVMSLQSLVRWGWVLSWSVISFKYHQCDQYLHCHSANIDSLTPLVPLHWTFHPWSNKDTLEIIHRTAQSFLFNQPRGVSAVC